MGLAYLMHLGDGMTETNMAHQDARDFGMDISVRPAVVDPQGHAREYRVCHGNYCVRIFSAEEEAVSHARKLVERAKTAPFALPKP